MTGGGQTRPQENPRLTASRAHVALTAEHMAEAIVRAAMATGETSLLAYRDEQALRGHVAFRARWVALAALVNLHPDTPAADIGRPLGCGPTPLTALRGARSCDWWDEAVAERLFLDLTGAPFARPIAPFAGLLQTVAGILGDLMTTKGGAA